MGDAAADNLARQTDHMLTWIFFCEWSRREVEAHIRRADARLARPLASRDREYWELERSVMAEALDCVRRERWN